MQFLITMSDTVCNVFCGVQAGYAAQISAAYKVCNITTTSYSATCTVCTCANQTDLRMMITMGTRYVYEYEDTFASMHSLQIHLLWHIHVCPLMRSGSHMVWSASRHSGILPHAKLVKWAVLHPPVLVHNLRGLPGAVVPNM